MTESPDRESASRADEYTRNFLQDEALPTIWQELAFHRRFIPEITLAEMNALARDWFPERNRLVIVSAPEAAGVVLPDQAQLAAVVKAASAKRLEALRGCRRRAAADGRAAATRRDREDHRRSGHHRVDAVERRHRGAEADDAQGGPDPVPRVGARRDVAGERCRLHSGARRRHVVPAGGVGRFNAVELDKVLAGKAVVVRPFIDEIDQGMGGGSTPQDLERRSSCSSAGGIGLGKLDLCESAGRMAVPMQWPRRVSISWVGPRVTTPPQGASRRWLEEAVSKDEQGASAGLLVEPGRRPRAPGPLSRCRDPLSPRDGSG